MPVVSVKINGKDYNLAPLRMKHLKQITSYLTSPKPNLMDRLEVWYPFIEFSVKEGGTPNFSTDELDELTMEQLLEVWTAVQQVTGITVGPKAGETKPVEQTGAPSTAA